MKGLLVGLFLVYIVCMGAAAMWLSVRRYQKLEMWVTVRRRDEQRRLDAWANALRARWENQGFKKK